MVASISGNIQNIAAELVDIRNKKINSAMSRLALNQESLTTDDIIRLLSVENESFKEVFISFIWQHPNYSKMLIDVLNGENEHSIVNVFQSFIDFHKDNLDARKLDTYFPKTIHFKDLFAKSAFRHLFA